MSSVIISGDTSGSITIAAPNVAGTNTLTLPASTGTFTVAGVNSNIVSGTEVASTSGTSITFTSIPSWVKRITVMFSQVSTSGTSNPLMQLGTSAGVTTSGYTSGTTYLGPTSGIDSYTAGFGLNSAAAGNSLHGSIVFSLLSSSTNTWVLSGVILMTGTSNFTYQMSGRVSLANTLDRVRITTVNGTDTFDAGSINILYE